MIEILKGLIGIKSMSGEEEDILQYIDSLLKRWKVGTWTRHKNSILWQTEIRSDRPTIALMGHVDTVPYDEDKWQVTHPLKALEKDGKIYGRGACDMKGGVAVILDVIRNKAYGDGVNVVAVFYDKEEVGIPNGITDLINDKKLPKIDFCIIPEPTSLVVNYGVFGNVDATFISKGKAAHTTRPDLGEHALYKLIPAISNVEKYEGDSVAGVKETAAVNMIKGGQARNIIPDHVEAYVDFRFNPRRSKSEVVELVNEWSGGDVDVRIDAMLNGVIHDPKENSYLSRLLKMVGKGEVDAFWSDIAQLANIPVVAVNFGPGSIDQAHIDDEFVPIKDLYELRSIIEEFLHQDFIDV